MENSEAQIRRLGNQRRVALELISNLPELLTSRGSFSRELNRRFRENSRFGSKDRRLYRELVYTYLRYETWLAPLSLYPDKLLDTLITLASPTPEIVPLLATVDESIPQDGSLSNRHRLIGKSDEELAVLLPDWFDSHFAGNLDLDNLRSLFSRPPLWARAQKGNAEQIVTQLRSEIDSTREQPYVHTIIPNAIHCPTDYPVQKCTAYQEGEIEIQDISSQALLQLIDPLPKGDWFDACAGAGGKTLQLAQMLGSAGRVFAYDPRSRALDELIQRTKRSGLRNISAIRNPPAGRLFTGVLVDAPCSGSGTWRRHPFLMRQTLETDIFEFGETQLELLRTYAPSVSPGGILAYCTCSLSRHENQSVAARFLKAHPEFTHKPLAERFGLKEDGLGITVLPHDFDGDGLYIATFKRDDS